MKRPIALLLFLLALLFACGAQAESEDAWLFAIVDNPDPADRLNLRTKPDTGAISLGKFYNGTPVTIERIDGQWAYVSLYEDFEGYMHTDYLAIGEEANRVESAMPIVTVISPMGKTVYDSMLEHPSVSAAFAMGSQLEVMGVMEDWLFVRSGSIVGFTENNGTMPRITFSTREETPSVRISIVPTPTPSPTPAPSSHAEYASVPVEGARNVTEDDWIIFASMKSTTPFYADKAMTQTIGMLKRGELVRIFNDIDGYATLVMDDRIAGYFPSRQNFIVHSAYWPFHIDQPSAAVENPVPSDRLHLRESPNKEAAPSVAIITARSSRCLITLTAEANGRMWISAAFRAT